MAEAVVTLSLGSRRIATFWGRPSLFRSLIEQMDGSTVKRRALKMASPYMVGSRRLRSIFGRESSQLFEIQDLAQPLVSVANELAMSIGAFAVFWPGGSRMHRRYIVASDDAGLPRLFAKASTKPSVDQPLFENEHRTLSQLALHPLRDWRVPRSYSFYSSKGTTSLVLESLASGRRGLGFSSVAAYLPLVLETPSVSAWALPTELCWYRSRALQGPGSQSFHRLVASHEGRLIRIGLVHGDVRAANALLIGARRWLIDWEYSSWEGPLALDQVVAVLNHLTSGARFRSQTSSQDILDALLGGCCQIGIGAPAVALCMLYLSGLELSSSIVSLMSSTWPRPQ